MSPDGAPGHERPPPSDRAAPLRATHPHLLPAWDQWYHVTISTYGQWLPGDQRGWRERHHRRHVEGDQHHPAPAPRRPYLHAYSAELMRNNAVFFSPAQRQPIVSLLLQALGHYQMAKAAIALDGTHLHLLIRIERIDPKRRVGAVKSWLWTQLNQSNLLLPGQRGTELWAKNNHPKPIRDAAHWRETYTYIVRHEDQGATVWSDPAARPDAL